MDQSHLPVVADLAQGAPTESSPLSHSVRHDPTARIHENHAGQRGSTLVDGDANQPELYRSGSMMSQSNTLAPSRGGTLKKKQSLKKSGSIKRSSSRKSLRPGSVTSLVVGDNEKSSGKQGDNELYSYTPVPTTGNPTEILADRFQGTSPPLSLLTSWRKVLKDLITYYRDLQKSYEARSKSLMSLSNVVNSTVAPPAFLSEGGLNEASQILKQYNKQAVAESNKARSIEEDVIVQLSGLRSDLQQKIKEIKSLSGDFKNAVDKEVENTRKAVRAFQEALGLAETDPSATSGKNDPFIVRLGVERQVEKQIDEENYLHRAFLNLESSGRELESIVVGEIQKAYNAYAGILRREADEAYDAAERLKDGPIALRKDLEWNAFIDNNEHFVDPQLPIRKAERMQYPGKNAPAAAEVRSGMLERKSKYLKSYTPGWYVLSPTHLHEFKSADSIRNQSPVMSLYLPEQKLGSHSNVDSSSHKFMLKGRQTGGMHRGHGWVFRAESRDTMLAWYEDIKSLSEKTGEERNAFVRKHARSVSGGSQKVGSVSSDGAMDEDEADEVPYSGKSSHFDHDPPLETELPEHPRVRPSPGSFPSNLSVNRGLHVPLSPSSGTSSDDREVIVTGGPLPRTSNPYGDGETTSKSSPTSEVPSRQPSCQMSQDKERLGLGDGPREPVATRSHVGSLATADAANRPSGPPRQASRQMQQKDDTSPSEHQISRSNALALQEASPTPIKHNTEHINLPVIQGSYHARPQPDYFPVQQDQTKSLPSEEFTAPAHGAEYQTQPGESYSVSSGILEAVARATQQDGDLAREPVIPPPSKSLSAPFEQPAFIGPDLMGTTTEVEEDTPAGAQPSPLEPSRTPPAPQPPSTITPKTLLTHLEPSQMQSPPIARTAPVPQKAEAPAPTSVESPTQRPVPTPAPTAVELGEFGSTPRVESHVTFDNSFSIVLSASAGARTGASRTNEVERDQEDTGILFGSAGRSMGASGISGIERDREQGELLPRRPEVKSQVSEYTISDLHVPGEFPRGAS